MRAPLSWLREYAGLPESISGRELGERLLRAGLEVETVDALGADLTGPLVVARVLTIEELSEFKKPIRYCTVDAGEPQPRGIVCGARNFAVGDLVVVALPGAVLPGGFAIAARQTYGRTSDGMICSTQELGLPDDSEGILVLPPDEAGALPGDDAVSLLGLRDDVLDIAVTADRGYALSLRGVAREAATAYGVPFTDPGADAPRIRSGEGYPVRVDDPAACPVFVALTVTGLDPSRPSPLQLQERVRKAGMRSISLAVDVTNVVMLELGQPLHAYDRDALSGPISVRRAVEGETLTTLDGTRRSLDPDDLLITDESGPIGLAGVMGGASTEISVGTTAVVIEAAHFAAPVIARAARRHRLSSEASRRFERGVDPALPWTAAFRAAELLVRYAGGAIEPDATMVGVPPAPAPIRMDAALPDRVTGCSYGAERVRELLGEVGCSVRGEGGALEVLPPTWRPDLTDPHDLVEEVARLHGYDAIPAVLPTAPAGRGLTVAQRARRTVAGTLAGLGYVEAPSYPFVSERSADLLLLPDDDARRRTLRLANPLSAEEPLLRTTLLPGLLTVLRRNIGRGLPDVALWEAGRVFYDATLPPAPHLPVDRRPTPEELSALFAAVPHQPWHLAIVLAGQRESRGWWGSGRPAYWADAIEAARRLARSIGVSLTARPVEHFPWHPGRCAALCLPDGTVVGHAGELHPRVTSSLEVPARTCAAELDLDALVAVAGGARQAPPVSTYPAATQDVALVVDSAVPAADVEASLRDGAGALLEDLRLFDVYTGEQVPAGAKSLAFALRLRAPDRTLTAEEASQAREDAVRKAAERTGAVLRS